MNQPRPLFIGIMSGTSLDGIDAVLASIGDDGEAAIEAAQSAPFSEGLRKALFDLQSSGPDEIHRESLAANALAQAYGGLVKALLNHARKKASDITAIGAHGQTIRHQPQFGYTHQTLNPALLAEITGIDVVADFRSRDLAAGGHGAPLVPAFHAQQFQSDVDVAILNLGGIANLTLLPKTGEVKGFDCGPGNMLMDAWIEHHQQKSFDKDGAWATQGRLHEELLARMLSDPFFKKAPPKSTGRDDFHLAWLEKHITQEVIEAVDVQMSLLHLTVLSTLEAVMLHAPQTQKLIVCGGGAKNIALMNLMRTKAPQLEIISSDSVGVDAQLVEALAFAWLAWAHKEKRPANLPAVTGAKGLRILGACYPA